MSKDSVSTGGVSIPSHLSAEVADVSGLRVSYSDILDRSARRVVWSSSSRAATSYHILHTSKPLVSLNDTLRVLCGRMREDANASNQ